MLGDLHSDKIKVLAKKFLKEAQQVLQSSGPSILRAETEAEMMRLMMVSGNNDLGGLRRLYAALWAVIVSDTERGMTLDSLISDPQASTARLQASNGRIPILEANIREVYHMEKFMRDGQRVLAPSVGLSHELLGTSIKDITLQGLFLPYDTIYILVPPELGFRTATLDSDGHPVEGIYVTSDGPFWHFLVVGSPLKNEKSYHFTVHYTSVMPENSKPLSQVLAKLGRTRMDQSQGYSVPIEALTDSYVAAIQFAVSVILYTNTVSYERIEKHPSEAYRKIRGDISKAGSNKSKRDKLNTQIAAFNPRKYVHLGPSEKGGAQNVKGVCIIPVRSHFRLQRVGPKLEKVRPTWIRSHKRKIKSDKPNNTKILTLDEEGD